MSLKRSEPHVSENPEIRQDQVEPPRALRRRGPYAADGDFKLLGKSMVDGTCLRQTECTGHWK